MYGRGKYYRGVNGINKMKTLLLSAFSVRRKLIQSGNSYINKSWALSQIKRLEYFLATGNALNIARKNQDILRVLLTQNFLKRFNEMVKCE